MGSQKRAQRQAQRPQAGPWSKRDLPCGWPRLALPEGLDELGRNCSGRCTARRLQCDCFFEKPLV